MLGPIIGSNSIKGPKELCEIFPSYAIDHDFICHLRSSDGNTWWIQNLPIPIACQFLGEGLLGG